MVKSIEPCPHDSLADLLDDLLPADTSQSVTAHVAKCVKCREELERLAGAPHVWRETRLVLSDPALREARASSLPSYRSSKGTADKEGQPLDERLRPLLPILKPSDDPQSLGRLDGYEIRSVVGWGGMGVVLRGDDLSLNRPVAIKVLHPHLAAHATARRRFAREARAAAAVNHPSVVPIYAVNSESNPPYIVMAYVVGGSLQERIDRSGPLELSEVLRIGLQIADALDAAHGQGLVHRDVKPGNILLDHGQDRVLLTDFGLAQALDDATLTASGLIAGTPQYMSPEQARGESVDPRSDLYSLGGVLYAMATGRAPYRGSSTLAILQQIGNEAPRAPSQLTTELPAWFDQFVGKLLARRPDDRPQRAAEVADLLRQCLAYVRRPAVNELPAAVVPTKPLAPTKAMDNGEEAPGKRFLMAFAALAVLVIAAVGALPVFLSHPWQIQVNDTGPRLIEETQFSREPPDARKAEWQFTPLPEDATRWDDGMDQPLSELRNWMQWNGNE